MTRDKKREKYDDEETIPVIERTINQSNFLLFYSTIRSMSSTVHKQDNMTHENATAKKKGVLSSLFSVSSMATVRTIVYLKPARLKSRHFLTTRIIISCS